MNAEPEFQVGDYVECVSSEAGLATDGIVFEVRSLPNGEYDYVVQVQLMLYGVFRSQQLRQLAPAAEPLELLVP